MVPVFRYALERWYPDVYEAVIVHNGNLSEEQEKVKEFLKETTEDLEVFNLYVNVVDLSLKEEGGYWRSFAEGKKDEAPKLYLFYPRMMRQPDPIWEAALTQENAELMIRSDVGQAIAREIVSGKSAVFLFMESGNKERDDAAYERLIRGLAEVEPELEIPLGIVSTEGEVLGGDEYYTGDPADRLRSTVPLKIDLATMRIGYDPKKEPILMASLLNMEPGLKEALDEPMVFIIFGRNRVLAPMIGKWINEESIYMVSEYVCGACSCQIKQQNPGVDLLVAYDWDSALQGQSAIPEKTLPPLEDIDIILTEEKPPPEEVAEVAPVLPESGEDGPAEDVASADSSPRNVFLMAIVGVAGVIFLGSLVIQRKS